MDIFSVKRSEYEIFNIRKECKILEIQYGAKESSYIERYMYFPNDDLK